ncbi:MAG: AIR synthase-related protein, partial [Candidatus Binatia bacterium]
HEMTAASGVGARLSFRQVPIMEEVTELARQGVVPGGSKRNLAHVEEFVAFDAAMDPVQRLMLADAQTSGGLLLAVPETRAATLVRALQDRGVPVVAEIGEIDDDKSGRIKVALP